MRRLIAIAGILTLTGCLSGGINYTQPQAYKTTGDNTVVIAKNRDAVWSEAIPRLGKEFFVINTMDKSSGLINLSYSGEPQKYIDCGRIHSEVTNARGHRIYDFSGASPSENYEFLLNNNLFSAHRKMSLDGRVNLIFEQLDGSHTRVTASTRYVVTKDFEYLLAGAQVPGHSRDSIAFNTGYSATFPGNGNQSACTATGALEKQILSLIQQ